MTVTLLRIDSSPMGDGAISRRLTHEFVQKWCDANQEAMIITRDLAQIEIPRITQEWVAANYAPKESRTREQSELLALSTEFITELEEADEYVIGMPMHNWGPPAALKLWVDQVVTPLTKLTRPLAGKRATFIIAAGGVYGPSSKDASKNYLVPWLRTIFGFLGVDDMQFVVADGARDVYRGKIDRAEFLASHREAVRDLFSAEKAERVASLG
ncbi:MAG: FMN-dependent NADH-azoreductase [Candidatus Acidiferrales bacterium]